MTFKACKFMGLRPAPSHKFVTFITMTTPPLYAAHQGPIGVAQAAMQHELRRGSAEEITCPCSGVVAKHCFISTRSPAAHPLHRGPPLSCRQTTFAGTIYAHTKMNSSLI